MNYVSNVARANIGRIDRASHISLKGIPITATSGDLRRAVMLAELKGVIDVSLIYKRFVPTGHAILTMASPDFTRPALLAAKNITFSGCETLTASASSDPSFVQRFRGLEGRANALNRSLLGTGPSAGFPPGKTVTITGIGGRVTPKAFKSLVEGFQLAGDKNSVMQVPLPEGKFSMYGRFVVVLASESEAQRLVRKLHLIRFKADSHPMMASVIY